MAVILPYLNLMFSCLSATLAHGSLSHHFALPGYTELVSIPKHYSLEYLLFKILSPVLLVQSLFFIARYTELFNPKNLCTIYLHLP